MMFSVSAADQALSTPTTELRPGPWPMNQNPINCRALQKENEKKKKQRKKNKNIVNLEFDRHFREKYEPIKQALDSKTQLQ